MKQKYKMRHRFTALLMAFMLCLSCFAPPAFALESSASTSASTSETSSAVESQSTPESAESTPETDNEFADTDVDETASENSDVEKDAELSAEAQSFISAVDALDRESILAAVNSWALASKAWQADKENPDLIAALDEATVVSDEASAPVTAAEDLYLSLSEEEQANEAVAAAYSALAALVVAMQAAIENPSVPSEGDGGDDAGSPSKLEEIHQMLYGDLPDAPTGSYMGSYGLPVATGDTKIGISYWNDDPSIAIGYMDSEALNSDGLSITVPRQAGESFAIVPIFAQVEYPANGSSSQIILPEDVVLLDYNGAAADEQTAAELLNAIYVEASAATTGIYVQADHDFAVTFRYNAPDGTSLEKNLNVHLEGETATQQAKANGVGTYEARPEPAVKTGKITSVQKVNGSWLIWFNGREAYCCTHGAKGSPNGCPTYNYSHTSIVTAAQYTPGDHYGNQVNIWGGLGQLSLGLMSADASMETAYDDVQRWVIANYPDSVAAKSYINAFEQMSSGVSTFAADSDYYTYIYQPPISGWQTVALIGPPTGSIDPDVPPAGAEYYASWSASPQTASGSFDANYTVNVDKEQLETGEKVDGATIEIEPLEKGGTIDGGNWSITPAEKQTVTTSGHTMDDEFQSNGGDASASWSLHYSVTKTSTSSLSGSEGPYSSQAEADAAAASAKASAEAQLRAEAQGMVDRAIAAAKSELASIDFRFDETVVPVGFEFYDGEYGSKQIISVPMDSSDEYLMRNDEWSLQVNIRKTDSETGETIASDAEYEVFEWDVVSQMYIPFHAGKPREATAPTYNGYYVVRNEDGTYSVANSTDYGTEFDTSRTMYYTQRNEGKFLIVETKAPDGYFGDWTDIEQPGEAGTPLGKRAYYIEITKDNDGSVIWLDNADYNADIATRYTGGTKLIFGGREATVTIYDQPQDAGRTYVTDSTGLANNEDSYTMIPQDNVFQNDRVLGEIILAKSDLDQLRPTPMSENGEDWEVPGTASHGEASIEGAVYDLYAAEDILHPDGVSGVVDYSKITYEDGTPIRHTTVRTNSGWDDSYLPILSKDHLVASAEIKDGLLVFSNLYLGRYYLVERATGLVLPVDTNSKFYVTGQYPELNRKLEPTGEYSPLEQYYGEYTDYVYKNQYSAVAEGRSPEGFKTYDGYYLSYAEGYLCDEINHYETLSYGDESGYVVREGEQSLDVVLKGGFELRKLVSTTGPGSPAPKLEGAGFTVYRIPDLSKADQFTRNPDGSYNVQSVLDAYRKDNYDPDTLKYDFSGEAQAIARMFESDTELVYAYNATLTEAGDYANGSGLGWVPTGMTNEFRLSELFTNEEGIIRVTGLPYGQYLVVETTIPVDVFQADPFGFTVDSDTPQSIFCQPSGSVTEPSNSYVTYNILDEEMEGYLKLIKVDAETGKAVELVNTAFAIYMIHEDGTKERLSMVDPSSGDPTEKTNVFYTDSEGRMKTPEKLPLGRYEVVELEGPNGFFNDEAYTVQFEISSDSAWEVVGNAVNGMDEYILTQEYINHETLGKLTIRKTGEVLTGWEQDWSLDILDPWFSGEAWPGNFTWEERPLAGAQYTITANEDIYTQDRQTDADGNRCLWYAKGDVVAVVTTGDGTSDIAVFRPGRTQATYDFLSVIHDKFGEVTVTLPLGSYHIEETKPPYGFTGTTQSYDVTFQWDEQTNSVVMAKSITAIDENGNAVTSEFEIVNAEDATAEFTEQQVLKFHNEREKAQVKVIKLDEKTGAALAGAVFNLYTQDDIYNADGDRLFRAGDLLATSAPTGEDGVVVFDCDLPMQDARYGEVDEQNSGRYIIRELRAPTGYFLNDKPMEFTFTYTGAKVQVLESACKNEGTSVFISKRQLTGDEELPGATLTIQDENGAVVRQWVSGDKPVEIRGLELNKVYTLVETIAPNGFAKAESIRFKLVQRQNEDGNLLPENDVYVCTDKDWLIVDHWTLMEDGTVVMRDAPAPVPEQPTPEQPAPTPTPVPPVPSVPQTGDLTWLWIALGIVAALSAGGLLLIFKCSSDHDEDEES
ncbi:MSCRAMM family protein [Ruthenibacterium lactatiformans]|uniref:MSCRAMM family protein n=1 Tax=Ruthenibacterium lactatiformans TaxID=1550024 RepID=UPI0022E74C4A|nr:SpaA isopeptide-forming pilin-related protein [Ruthenibacterium lactatiformans]